MYTLELINQCNHIQLKLSRSNTVLRTWNGNFAQVIFDKIAEKHPSDDGLIYLSKFQIHSLFTEITCLYQSLIFHYKIETDLITNKFPQKFFNIAESLLLFIRINASHPSYEDLQSYYIDEYKHFDISCFSHTINLLIGKNLIQSIITNDGNQFFDKNPTPHEHIYFTQEKKLVDCTKEISNILFNKQQLLSKNQNCKKIFYTNSEISHIFY